MTININIDTNESLNISVNQHHIPTWVYANSQTEHELKRIRLAQHQRELQKQEELQQQHLRQLRLQRERQAREKAKKELETKKRKKQLNSQYGYKAQKRHQKQDDGPEL